MRWRLWPFRPDTPAAVGAEGARPAGPDWASLPSIQRAVGTTRLTADSVSFVRGLSSRTPPDLALARLGHVRSPEAPAGILVARALTVAPARPPSLLKLLRPRPRAAQATLEAAPVENEAAPVESEVAPVESEVAAEPVRPPGTGAPFEVDSSAPPTPTLVALRRAGVVAAPPRVPPVAVSLTRALGVEPAVVDVEPPVAQLAPPEPRAVEEPPMVMPGEPAPAAARLNLGQSRRLGLGPRLTPEPPLAQRRSGDVQAAIGGEPGADPVAPAALEARPSSRGEPTTLRGAVAEVSASPVADLTPSSAGVIATAGPAVPGGAVMGAPESGPSPVAHMQRPEQSPPEPAGRVAAPILRVRRGAGGGSSQPARQTTIQAAGERVAAEADRTGAPAAAAPPPKVSGDATPGPSAPAGAGPRTPLVLRATTAEEPPAPEVDVAPSAAEVPASGGGAVSPAGPEAAAPIVPAATRLAGAPAPLVFRATPMPPGAAVPVVSGPEGGEAVQPTPSQGGTADPTVSGPGSQGGEAVQATPLQGGAVDPVVTGRGGRGGAAVQATSSKGATADPVMIGRGGQGGEAVPPASSRLGIADPGVIGHGSQGGETARAGRGGTADPLLIGRGEPARAASPPGGTPDPVVARAVAAGAVGVAARGGTAGGTVRDITGSRPSLPLSAAGLRASLSVQPSLIEPQRSGPPPVAPMPAARPPRTMADQALSGPVPAAADPPGATAAMPLFRPESPSAPAAVVVQPLPGLSDGRLTSAAGELGSARDAVESELGRAGSEPGRVASDGRAVEARAAQGAGAAEQAVGHQSGGGAGLAGSDRDVEELAGRLYDRIRSRLRSELLIGRERAGRITDLR